METRQAKARTGRILGYSFYHEIIASKCNFNKTFDFKKDGLETFKLSRIMIVRSGATGPINIYIQDSKGEVIFEDIVKANKYNNTLSLPVNDTSMTINISNDNDKEAVVTMALFAKSVEQIDENLR